MKAYGYLVAVAALALAGCSDAVSPPSANAPGAPSLLVDQYDGGAVSGAIFTTTPNGGIVNENVHYPTKLDVYLDGGPPPNAPMTAAGLPNGLYVFQVTNPSGEYLLSQDPARCRVVQVSGGVIIKLLKPTDVPGLNATSNNWSDGNGPNGSKACQIQDGDPTAGVFGPSGQHDWNYDLDHGPPAIVVQLMPFLDTPNPGGVYKAWMTPLAIYRDKTGNLNNVPGPITKVKGVEQGFARDPGFGPPRDKVKTDNFKAKLMPFVTPTISVSKFHDRNMNGVQNAGEESILHWPVNYTTPDPLDPTATLYTPWTLLAAINGTWTFTEQLPSGIQTVSYRDGTQLSLYPTANPVVAVTVAGTSGETHTVVYGDVGIGQIKVCKVYDNGSSTPIASWKVTLTRTKDAAGNAVSASGVTKTTGSDGCATFASLLPGTYLAEEVMAKDYEAVGATSFTVDLVSGLTYNNLNEPTLAATAFVNGSAISKVEFKNRCFATANFFTKGYWHNKNGLQAFTDAFVQSSVNTLLPYKSPSSYFGAGDEPFDGKFANGDPVAAAFSDLTGEMIAPAGSLKAEVSAFLVDPNSGGDPREQLAQQLLAFIFNVQYGAGSGAQVKMPDGTFVSASSLINQAITIWSSGTATQQNEMAGLLDWFNNHESTPVSIVPGTPCPVQY